MTSFGVLYDQFWGILWPVLRYYIIGFEVFLSPVLRYYKSGELSMLNLILPFFCHSSPLLSNFSMFPFNVPIFFNVLVFNIPVFSQCFYPSSTWRYPDIVKYVLKKDCTGGPILSGDKHIQILICDPHFEATANTKKILIVGDICNITRSFSICLRLVHQMQMSINQGTKVTYRGYYLAFLE